MAAALSLGAHYAKNLNDIQFFDNFQNLKYAEWHSHSSHNPHP